MILLWHRTLVLWSNPKVFSQSICLVQQAGSSERNYSELDPHGFFSGTLNKNILWQYLFSSWKQKYHRVIHDIIVIILFMKWKGRSWGQFMMFWLILRLGLEEWIIKTHSQVLDIYIPQVFFLYKDGLKH